MLLAAHQPNFIPWAPFFEKMAMCDVFVLMTHCQFEKGGVQNRQKIFGKYWTNPVNKGLEEIDKKHYTDGNSLVGLNELWIYSIAKTLSINEKKIRQDFKTEAKGTDRIVEICKYYKADSYLADISSVDKYLEINKLEDNGIKFVPFYPTVKKHVFELFDKHGIEGTRRLLKCHVDEKKEK